MAKPFYGVDGNLLVADLPHHHDVVEAILDGRFKPAFWAQQFLPITLWTKYPQLADEWRKRKHRRESRAELAAARAIGVEIKVLYASTEAEIDAAFASLPQIRALRVSDDIFFNNRIPQLIELAARYTVPTLYAFREFPLAGGLMSYGYSLADIHRQNGLQVARILKGEKPADLPVVQTAKIELVINLKTAKALDLTVPPSLLARADEVIE
jgi:ABC-type uncharacterized transport system substrate-binding protein